MKNKLLIGISALFLIGGALVAPRLVSAYRGDPSVQGPNCTPERHELMIQAFESDDYNAWKELMQAKGKVTELVSEDNFGQFAQAHRLALEGNTEEANQIREELGLGLGNRHGRGEGNSNGKAKWSE